MSRPQQGFTAVELLISLVVAMLLLGSAYQLYTAVLRDSAASQQEAIASNVAYDLMRQYEPKATSPCTTKTEHPSIPSYATLPSGKATAKITCPYGSTSNLSLVTITIDYNDPQPEEVVHAIVTTS